jgi:hypothetical protein
LRSPYSCDWSLTSPRNRVSNAPAYGFKWSSELRPLTYHPSMRGQRSSSDEAIQPGDLPSRF